MNSGAKAQKAAGWATLFLVTMLSLAVAGPSNAGPVVDAASVAEEKLSAGDVRGAHEALREAYRALWTAGPLFIRKSVPVTEPASAFGAYTPRGDTTYSEGERIRIYVEPAGFNWSEDDGGFAIAFDVDVEIASSDGAVVWGRKGIYAFEQKLLEPTFEFFETLTFDFTGLPAGDYSIVTTLRDQASEKSASFETPITIE